jgi:hypothetical protein
MKLMAKKLEIMTTTGGNPVTDNQNSLTAGAHGPLLMQDYQLLEKLAHQNRERIPERIGQELLCETAVEVSPVFMGQNALQLADTLERFAGDERARRIDRLVALLPAPDAHGVEILER